MHDKSISDKKIQWHPGFYAAAEIELRQNRADLEYHREYNLGISVQRSGRKGK